MGGAVGVFVAVAPAADDAAEDAEEEEEEEEAPLEDPTEAPAEDPDKAPAAVPAGVVTPEFDCCELPDSPSRGKRCTSSLPSDLINGAGLIGAALTGSETRSNADNRKKRIFIYHCE